MVFELSYTLGIKHTLILTKSNSYNNEIINYSVKTKVSEGINSLSDMSDNYEVLMRKIPSSASETLNSFKVI